MISTDDFISGLMTARTICQDHLSELEKNEQGDPIDLAVNRGKQTALLECMTVIQQRVTSTLKQRSQSLDAEIKRLNSARACIVASSL